MYVYARDRRELELAGHPRADLTCVMSIGYDGYINSKTTNTEGNDMAITYGKIREAKADRVAPRNPYADGYGPMVPTQYWVRLDTDKPTARWRRVYCAVYGNSGSIYVVVNDVSIYLNDLELESRLEAAAYAAHMDMM
jgi:hypothetical protein